MMECVWECRMHVQGGVNNQNEKGRCPKTNSALFEKIIGKNPILSGNRVSNCSGSYPAPSQ